VVVSARTLLLWSRNPLQVVYVDTRAPPDCQKRFAFAHGTLLGHMLVRLWQRSARSRRLSALLMQLMTPHSPSARPAPAQAGEERFAVELRRDGSVWYDIFTFSRPGCLLARVSYPVARAQQRAFARQSLAAVAAAVQQR
jgi:uncharacterized protein (UPF0548 family)